MSIRRSAMHHAGSGNASAELPACTPSGSCAAPTVRAVAQAAAQLLRQSSKPAAALRARPRAGREGAAGSMATAAQPTVSSWEGFELGRTLARALLRGDGCRRACGSPVQGQRVPCWVALARTTCTGTAAVLPPPAHCCRRPCRLARRTTPLGACSLADTCSLLLHPCGRQQSALRQVPGWALPGCCRSIGAARQAARSCLRAVCSQPLLIPASPRLLRVQVDELERKEEELFRTGPLSVLTTSVKTNSQVSVRQPTSRRSLLPRQRVPA